MKTLVLSIVLFAVTVGTFSQSRYYCSDYVEDDSSSNLLEDMGIYATIIEYAFKSRVTTCKNHGVQIDGPSIGRVFHMEPVIKVANYQNHEEEFSGSVLYSDKDGQYVIECRNEGTGPTLGIRISAIMRLGPVFQDGYEYGGIVDGKWLIPQPNNVGVAPEVHFVLDVSIVSSGSFLEELKKKIGNLLGDQELQVATLSKVRPVDGITEDMYLINGTQFAQLESVLNQVNTSFNDIIGNSCAFSLAAYFIRNELGRDWSKVAKVSVAGHSLGGAATQFIAADIQRNGSSYQLNSFGAYSFNSLGARGDGEVDDLYSFHLKGDILSRVQKHLGRVQPGIDFLYVPLDGFGIGRHGLKHVQRALCLCRCGKGEAEITQR